MRKSIALAITAVTTAGLAAFVPATANAASGSTPVTFTLTGGALSLTVPSATATLAGGALTITGSSVTGQLGTTTVSDARGLLTATDTVTMSTTNFSDGLGNTVLAAGNATGYSGVATPTGTGVPVPTVTGQNIAGAGSTILTIAVIGSGGASYNPTVSVAIPAGAVQGVYTGTVTQSVS